MGREPQGFHLSLQGVISPVPSGIAVDPGCGGGGKQPFRGGVYIQEFPEEIPVPFEIVFLVILLRRVKASRRQDLREERGACLLRESLPARKGLPFLLIIEVKEQRLVLSFPGPEPGGVTVPEKIQQLFEGDQPGVVLYQNRFRMISQVMIGGMIFCPPGIACPGAEYPFQKPEPGVRSPESSHPEERLVPFGRLPEIYGGEGGSVNLLLGIHAVSPFRIKGA